jgi:uncharacterized protein
VIALAVHLTVIAKEPRPGHVKTRLCPPCTPTEAAAVAAAALTDTLDAVDALCSQRRDAVERVLLFDGDPTGWCRTGWRAHAQRGGALGERLANGFDDLGPGVIVGMETPHVVDGLHAALDAVQDGRDAIGLATDGGYWAIALGTVDRAVFAGVPMSATHTGLSQLRRLHLLGRLVVRLPIARDLDNFDDLVDAAVRRHGTAELRAAARSVHASVLARTSGADGGGDATSAG